MKRKQLKIIRKAKKLEQEVKKEFRTHVSAAITAGFAFLIALVWRDAIQEGVNTLITNLNIKIQQIYLYKIYLAITVTIVCVIALILFSKWGSKKE